MMKLPVSVTALMVLVALPAAASAATVDGVTASASWSQNSGLTASVGTTKGHLKRVAFRSNTLVTNPKIMTGLIPNTGIKTLGTVTVGAPLGTLNSLNYLGINGVWPIRLKATTPTRVNSDFFGFGEGIDAPSALLRATEPFMTVRRRTVTSPFTIENLAKDWKISAETVAFSGAPSAVAPAHCPSTNAASIRVERYGASAVTVDLIIHC